MADTRTGQRFPLHLPIKIENGAKLQRALTHDLSAAGVFIEADPSLRVGAHVMFKITLPHELLGVAHDVDVECEGRVVRVEKGKAKRNRVGLACVIDRYEFVRRT